MIKWIIINKVNSTGKLIIYYCNNKYNVGEITIHFKSSNQKSIIESKLFDIKILISSIKCCQEIINYYEFKDT